MSQNCEVEGLFYFSYSDITNILDNNDCSSCHANGNKEGNWSYDTYLEMLTTGFCNQPTIIHGNASQSFLYTNLTGGDDLCGEPNLRHEISNSELDQIETWINHGAPEKCMPLYAEIKTIFDDNNCQSCHSQPSDSWTYQNYFDLIGNGLDDNCQNRDNVVLESAISSLLYDKINDDGVVTCGEMMDGNNGPLSEEELIKVRDWINAGAPESAISLPVILSTFEVYENDGKIRLNWTTEVEIATDKFIVERSGTGRDFKTIGDIDTEGSGSSSTDYDFLDEAPLYGENYYRLRILDLDGSYDYSNIRFARIENNTAEMTVWPNPAMSQDRLRVTWFPRGEQDRTYLNIVDINGQYLDRKIIFVGTNYVRLPRLLEGVYYVMVEDYFGGFLLERIVIIN